MSRQIARVAAVLAVIAVAGGGAAARADTPPDEVYGMAVDPLAEFDWAPPVDDPAVAQAAAEGATVTSEMCAFGGRPGTLDPQLFRRPVRTTGHLVVTPSGNVTFTCHAALDARSLEPPLPDAAVVVDHLPCFLPGGRRTNDARLVLTPSLQAQLICHVQPAG